MVTEIFESGSVQSPRESFCRNRLRTETSFMQKRHNHIRSIGGNRIKIKFADTVKIFLRVDRNGIHFDVQLMEKLHILMIELVFEQADAHGVIIDIRFLDCVIFHRESLQTEFRSEFVQVLQLICKKREDNHALFNSASADDFKNLFRTMKIILLEFNQKLKRGIRFA